MKDCFLHQKKDLNSTPAQRRRSQPPQWRGSVPSRADKRERFLLHKLRHIKNGVARESLRWAGAEEKASKSSRVLYLFGKQSKTEAEGGSIQHYARVGFSLVRDYNFFSRLNLARPVSWEQLSPLLSCLRPRQLKWRFERAACKRQPKAYNTPATIVSARVCVSVSVFNFYAPV